MEEFLTLVKDFAFRRETSSGKINPTPAYVFSAHLVASLVGAATAVLRNGHDTNAEAKIDLSAIAYSADPRIFVPPIYFDKGIYLDVGSNVVSVVIQFRQTRDIEALTGTRSLKSYIPSWLGGPRKGREKA